MRRGLTSLNQSEQIWWHNFRREAEMQAWKRMQTLFPRLNNFEAPAGRMHGFKFQNGRPGGGSDDRRRNPQASNQARTRY